MKKIIALLCLLFSLTVLFCACDEKDSTTGDEPPNEE